MAKLNYVINTGGEVKIVDYDLNEILTVSNRELHSDQFGYSMIATDLMIDGKITPCLSKYFETNQSSSCYSIPLHSYFLWFLVTCSSDQIPNLEF